MRFTASTEILKSIVALAYNASIPVGMGHYHFTPDDMSPDDIFRGAYDGPLTEIHVDYLKGRMVKLSLRRVENNTWEVIGDCTPRSDCQSWDVKYPTYRALIEAAGATEQMG